MTQKQKHYSKQFKIDAVKLVTEQGYRVVEAARNLALHDFQIACKLDKFSQSTSQDIELITIIIIGVPFFQYLSGRKQTVSNIIRR